jgi:pyruvate kinase
VVADLCGPKIRVGPVRDGAVLVADGQTLTICRESVEGDPERISTTLPELVDEARPGEKILIDDGKLLLTVGEAGADRLVCEVVRGGMLASGKGVNLPDTQLTLSALTEKDRQDAAWIAERDFDYVALSFVRSSDDIETLRALLADHDCDAPIIAKIEKPQAVENIEAILAATDAVMVARGDLGVEMELEKVPAVQKRIARLAQRAGKPCIIATQMLETMTRAAAPTRAEVSDVANAVLDHTDAVMLSGETAVGDDPPRAVAMMNRIVAEMQAYHDDHAAQEPVDLPASATTAALAASVREVLRLDGAVCVAAISGSGTTVRVLAKNRLPRPILGLSPDLRVVRRMALYYGVQAAHVAESPAHTRDVLALAARRAKEMGLADAGEKIVVLSGRPIGQAGATNTLVVHTIP